MEKNNLNIAFATDDNYCQHLSVALTSIIKNKHQDTSLNIYILYDELYTKNIQLLQSLATEQIFINFVKIDKKDFASCPLPKEFHFSLPTYFRLKLADILPDINKILYLDCDIIVKKDLSELYNHNIENFYAGATRDYKAEESRQRLELNSSDGFYFNAGVMLINLKKWREDNLTNKFFEFINTSLAKITWVDQDVLNCCLYGKVLELNQTYNAKYFDSPDDNFQENTFFSSALNNPTVIHYLACIKPWHKHCNHPLKSEYFDYLKQSPYAKIHEFENKVTDISEMTPSERSFLGNLIHQHQPKKIVEIGVAAGASSAIILNEIKDIKDAKLYSLDYSTQYYRNANKLTGFIIKERFPELLSKWELKTGGLSCNFLEDIGGEIDLCLLDTMHSNPGEFLDFLMILPYLKKNAIVVIHDTTLHLVSKYNIHTTCGTLLSAISGEKLSPSYTEHQFPNIGASIIDTNQKDRIFDIFHLLTLPWHYKLSDKDVLDLNNFFPQHYKKEYCDFFKKAVACNHEWIDNNQQQAKSKIYKKKQIKFLGLTLFKKEKKNNTTKYYFFGIKIWKKKNKKKNK